jgi:catechol 2,3-dioxygenase-like lactoylglutathione lyase family enzyme
MLNRFHSAVLDVQDFEAAVSHYGTLLGREPSWLGRNAERGSRSAFFRLANMALEVCDPGRGARTREGLRAIRLDAQDVADLPARLSLEGVEILETTRESSEESSGAQTLEWTRCAIDPTSSRGIEVEILGDMTHGAFPEARVDVPAQSAVRDLDHVVIFSEDVESTRDFYLEGLGIRLALDKTFDDRQVRLLFFRLGGVTIEIGSRLGARPEAERPDRFGGLAWEVESADEIRERLLGADFDVSEVRPGNKAGTRVCTVRSPVHGVPTLLIQPVSR